jgi:hypothetical protein
VCVCLLSTEKLLIMRPPHQRNNLLWKSDFDMKNHKFFDCLFHKVVEVCVCVCADVIQSRYCGNVVLTDIYGRYSYPVQVV